MFVNLVRATGGSVSPQGLLSLLATQAAPDLSHA
jgi:hypothetical protein